jgi:hypothetical protein
MPAGPGGASYDWYETEPFAAGAAVNPGGVSLTIQAVSFGLLFASG